MNTLKHLLFSAACLVGISSQAHAISYSEKQKLANDGVVKIISGSRKGTYLQLTDEMKSVLPGNSGEKLRIVPMIGLGSWQNIEDLLYMKGVDVALMQSDVLQVYYEKENQKVKGNVRYIAKLHDEEVHLLASKSMKSLEDLRGKRVGFGAQGSGTAMTAENILKMISLDVIPVFKTSGELLKDLRARKIDAFFYVSGKPVSLFSEIKAREPFHFISIDKPALNKVYSSTKLDSGDYSNLIESGEIKTVSVQAVLGVYNFDKNSPRYKNIERFSRSLFRSMKDLKDSKNKYHKKWQEIDACGEVIGWERLEVLNPIVESECGTTAKGGSSGLGDHLEIEVLRQLLTDFYANKHNKQMAETIVSGLSDEAVRQKANEVL